MLLQDLEKDIGIDVDVIVDGYVVINVVVAGSEEEGAEGLEGGAPAGGRAQGLRPQDQ